MSRVGGLRHLDDRRWGPVWERQHRRWVGGCVCEGAARAGRGVLRCSGSPVGRCPLRCVAADPPREQVPWCLASWACTCMHPPVTTCPSFAERMLRPSIFGQLRRGESVLQIMGDRLSNAPPLHHRCIQLTTTWRQHTGFNTPSHAISLSLITCCITLSSPPIRDVQLASFRHHPLLHTPAKHPTSRSPSGCTCRLQNQSVRPRLRCSTAALTLTHSHIHTHRLTRTPAHSHTHSHAHPTPLLGSFLFPSRQTSTRSSTPATRPSGCAA